jgi:cytoskeletal protein RodZ
MRYPKKRKKIKTYLALAFCSFVLILGLVAWAGISAVEYIASASTQTLLPTAATQQITKLKEESKILSTFQPMSCLDKAQSLISVQPWLEQSVSLNFLDLKAACFGAQPTSQG